MVQDLAFRAHRKVEYVAQDGVCTHAGSILCAHHHATYSLEPVIDG